MHRYPPGPINFNALFGLTWRHAFRLWRDALGFLDALRAYGDIAFFRLFTVRAYVVNHPDLIREVLVTQREKFRKLPRDVRAVRQITGDGIIVSDGETWRRHRRLVQPAFHASRMEQYATLTVDQTRRMLDRWQQSPTLDVPAEMSDLTMRISLRAMFGIELKREDKGLVEAARILSDTFIREIHAVFTLPDWLPLPSKMRKRKAIAEFDRLIRGIIAERRGSGQDTGDLLSMLLLAKDDEDTCVQEDRGSRLNDQQVRDEAMTLFTAAFHANSMALTWTWYLLARYPDVYQRVVDEVDTHLGQRPATFADVESLPQTQAVLKESLRLYPPAWALFCRQAQEDVELAGYQVRRGSWVFLYPYLTHRDGRFFPDPERFDPDRFLPERIKDIPPYAYFPFGAGPRACIGSAFAMMQMTLILATVMQRVRLELLPQQPEVQVEPLLALRPRGGLTMSVIRRHKARVDSAAGCVPTRDSH